MSVRSTADLTCAVCRVSTRVYNVYMRRLSKGPCYGCGSSIGPAPSVDTAGAATSGGGYRRARTIRTYRAPGCTATEALRARQHMPLPVVQRFRRGAWHGMARRTAAPRAPAGVVLDRCGTDRRASAQSLTGGFPFPSRAPSAHRSGRGRRGRSRVAAAMGLVASGGRISP